MVQSIPNTVSREAAHQKPDARNRQQFKIDPWITELQEALENRRARQVVEWQNVQPANVRRAAIR